MDDLGVPLFLETSKYQAQNQAFQSFGNFHVQHLSGEPLFTQPKKCQPRPLKPIAYPNTQCMSYPIGSMYGIFTYIWLIFMVNVAKYTIHGSYGYLPTSTIEIHQM